MGLVNQLVVYLILALALGTEILAKTGEQELLNNPGILNWEGSENIKNKFLYYLSGYDYDNLPVVVAEMGRWDFQGVAEKGGKDLEDANIFIDQLNTRLQRGYFRKDFNGSYSESSDNEAVVIVDFEGLRISQLSSPPTLKLILDRLGKMGKIYNSIASGFIVNANPVAHQVIGLSKPFIGNFLEKMEVYGTNSRKFIPQILKKIPRSQLHAAYGGYKDFRPITIYG